ncbi:MAG: KpsF/GutQ family sugar-phosphate isomerase [Proteobacteria bacterium]|nr:KpsF/GutQ family sugar-phosphate isomerase [Pseudomonadota bacterium]
MLIDTAKEVIDIEIKALDEIKKKIDKNFEVACKILFECKGKVVVTGIGKSGIIGQKIAATFASTGTPAFFMHPSEGLHGDLGVLSKNDVVLAISNSGETEEIVKILPIIKRLGNLLIVMSGRKRSSLAKAGDVFLDIGVKKEACPLNLAPTASTTATLALGDALAVALIKMRGFKEEDFAFRHPAGALGRKLFLKVSDLMHKGEDIPLVNESTNMKDTIYVISSKKLGVTGVINSQGKLVGIITDGDLRRAIEKHENIFKMKASDIMTKNPKWILGNEMAVKALQIMENYSITTLFVFDKPDTTTPTGIIHLHDILKAGIV